MKCYLLTPAIAVSFATPIFAVDADSLDDPETVFQ